MYIVIVVLLLLLLCALLVSVFVFVSPVRFARETNRRPGTRREVSAITYRKAFNNRVYIRRASKRDVFIREQKVDDTRKKKILKK